MCAHAYYISYRGLHFTATAVIIYDDVSVVLSLLWVRVLIIDLRRAAVDSVY
jgi:hypothetical protein